MNKVEIISSCDDKKKKSMLGRKIIINGSTCVADFIGKNLSMKNKRFANLVIHAVDDINPRKKITK